MLWRALRQPKLTTLFILQRFDEFLFSGLWLLVSRVIQVTSSRSGRNVSPVLQQEKIATVIYAIPEPFTNTLFRKRPPSKELGQETQDYPGPNLPKLGLKWFSEVFGANAQECQAPSKLEMAQDGSTVFSAVMSPTPIGLSRVPYLLRIISFGLFLRKRKIPAVLFLPDTFYPDAAIFSSVLASLTGGVTAFLQNTADEATAFGYPNAIGPIFWTWPPSRAGTLDATPSWSSRKDICLLPGGNTGGTARSIMASEFSEQLLSDKRFSTFVTDGSLSETEYLSALDVAKLSMTANFVQDNFNIGWKAYRERMTDETTTGRVWEAFSRGQVLVCNETRVLNELGFFPGLHYVELATVLDGSFPLARFTDRQLEGIAAAGQGRFMELLKATDPIKSAVARILERH